MSNFFENASHFHTGDINLNNHFHPPDSQNEQTLKDLYEHVATVAMHSSSARVDAPKCHEETRQAVKEDMISWSQYPGLRRGTEGPVAASSEAQDILWLTGPAGTGKTAIMGTMSHLLESKWHLAAAFYFSAAMGPAGTTSKRFFVTTLAYQLAVHTNLKGALASPILSAIRANPAIFDLSPTRQLELLVLQPLRLSQSQLSLTSLQSSCLLVDGVDECEGSGSGSSRPRSRQEDQIEVLSVLLQAANDPAFPFRIIIASRPETWIRAYLSERAAGRVHEIFLDEKYSPDDDIRLYLKSKFAEKSREYHISTSTWPSEDAINQLVKKASGQFIYAATAVRFVDAPGASPHAQLDTLLGLKLTPAAQSGAFASLDALYTSIVNMTPNPETTVLWLKGLHFIQEITGSQTIVPSAWTIHRLFESHEGQAQTIFGSLPSLLYLTRSRTSVNRPDTDRYGTGTSECARGPEWARTYSFYHKSFLDYLQSDTRSGSVYPSVTKVSVEAWLRKQCAEALKRGGPELPLPFPLLSVFRACFLDLLVKFEHTMGLWAMEENILSHCDPSIWLCVVPLLRLPPINVERIIYVAVHKPCRSYRPCTACCKLWRRAISSLPADRWRSPGTLYVRWTSGDIILDKLRVKLLVP